ncbi:hypothetical protein QJS10_CPB17g02446 [Acorus calamus]|uniref:Uncharacterized protein n=1 Tax=Acorus calamus TaxID=4465 RepID=A0AAV9CQP2_ACOCL|nr:hypothetical protein QJS10_CPB17g02446 [Acorus calamus]
MDKSQELEWLEAQKLVISEDLIVAAKQQLRFLEEVDRNRCLYESPILDRAIHRYKNCWLPLLAKYADSEVLKGPLVQYKADCEAFYGRILSNKNVRSIVQGCSKVETAHIWNHLYPEEVYELDYGRFLSVKSDETFSGATETITYDLASAVKRQATFFYQVSRPSMNDDRFLQEAVGRYKGFLYMIKRNRERSIRRFCVPTYDIDLIWHSHQLQPVSYCKDMLAAIGKILEHDDTDSDRSKGKKLNVGFSETSQQYEETFGIRYWKAGAMYRNQAPSPVATTPYSTKHVTKNVSQQNKYQKYIQLPQKMVVDVLLEIVGIRNKPDGQKGNFFVTFSTRKPDMFLEGGNRNLKNTNSMHKCLSKRKVIGVTRWSEEAHVLAVPTEDGWSLMDSNWALKRLKKTSQDEHIFELRGPRSMKLFHGRKLEFEPKTCMKQNTERDFMTVVEFSAEYPYGKAVALFNIKHGTLKVNEESLVLPILVSAYIFFDMLRKDGYSAFMATEETVDMEIIGQDEAIKVGNDEFKTKTVMNEEDVEVAPNKVATTRSQNKPPLEPEIDN